MVDSETITITLKHHNTIKARRHHHQHLSWRKLTMMEELPSQCICVSGGPLSAAGELRDQVALQLTLNPDLLPRVELQLSPSTHLLLRISTTNMW